MPRLLKFLAGCAAGACIGAQADPGCYVVTAYSDPGRKTVEARYWTVAPPGSPMVKWPELGVAWNTQFK